MTNPDLTCELFGSLGLKPNQANRTRGFHHRRWLETVGRSIRLGKSPALALTTPRPEVNIGIVCANAPILRPLYLFFRGRLASQIRSNNAGVSKEGMWPNNTPRAMTSPAWKDESNDTSVGDTSVSLEMGLHSQSQNPLREKPYFIMDAAAGR